MLWDTVEFPLAEDSFLKKNEMTILKEREITTTIAVLTWDGGRSVRNGLEWQCKGRTIDEQMSWQESLHFKIFLLYRRLQNCLLTAMETPESMD